MSKRPDLRLSWKHLAVILSRRFDTSRFTFDDSISSIVLVLKTTETQFSDCGVTANTETTSRAIRPVGRRLHNDTLVLQLCVCQVFTKVADSEYEGIGPTGQPSRFTSCHFIEWTIAQVTKVTEGAPACLGEGTGLFST